MYIHSLSKLSKTSIGYSNCGSTSTYHELQRLTQVTIGQSTKFSFLEFKIWPSLEIKPQEKDLLWVSNSRRGWPAFWPDRREIVAVCVNWPGHSWWSSIPKRKEKHPPLNLSTCACHELFNSTGHVPSAHQILRCLFFRFKAPNECQVGMYGLGTFGRVWNKSLDQQTKKKWNRKKMWLSFV